MRLTIQLIAAVYGLLGAAGALQWLHALLFTGMQNSSADLPCALFFLIVANGLATFRPWARGLVLVLSALFGVGGILGLIFCLGHIAGFSKASGGLIVERPLLAFLAIAGTIVAGFGQWWVLTRPAGRRLFYPEQT
jgi:hypothetical protein